MRRHILITGIAIALIATSFGVAAAAAEKVDVCHVPPGDPGNAHTITVGEPAVSAHLAHGDYLGQCSTTGNRPPEADAGQDQCVLFGEEVALDGSGSSDPDDDPLTFTWSLQEGPDGSTSTPADLTAAQTTFTPDRLGEYMFSLQVADAEFTDDDSTTIRVTMDVQLDADSYEVAMGESVAVTATLHSAAPAGGASVDVDLDDDLAVLTATQDGTDALAFLKFPPGETSITVWLQGLAAGETSLTLTAGSEECYRSASADVSVTLPVNLQALLDEIIVNLGVDFSLLEFDLDRLLGVGTTVDPEFGDSDIWQRLMDELENLQKDVDNAVDSLLGNG